VFWEMTDNYYYVNLLIPCEKVINILLTLVKFLCGNDLGVEIKEGFSVWGVDNFF